MKDNTTLKLTIESIVKRIDKQTIRFDHPLQRKSGQWSKLMMGNLISDILQDNPIPSLVFAEEIVNGAPIIWDLDGKQRCMNVYNFVKGEYRISKNITRYMIEYYVPIVGEDGKKILDDDGYELRERKEFDIRGKKFSELPKDLQDNFTDYGFEIVQYINCSPENIAYHISRYNEGKPMNPSQKGITNLGGRFASVVNNIASMSFFEDGIGKYPASQFKSGAVNRAIVESVMTSTYLDEWKKDFAEICKFLKENATGEDFEMFRALVDRLEECVSEEVGQMFDSTNSFIWFGLFSRFAKLGLEDSEFNTFMLELNKGMSVGKDEPMTGLCKIEIDGTDFEALWRKSSTKDKKIVVGKIEFLTKLMCQYFNVEMPKEDDIEELNGELADFAQDFISDEIAMQTLMLVADKCPYNNFEPETINKTIEWFIKQEQKKKIFDDCIFYKAYLKDNGIAEDDINLPLYVYAVKYIFDNNINIDVDKWLTAFKTTAFSEIDADERNNPKSNLSIILKQQLISNNIKNFLTKEECLNENVCEERNEERVDEVA